MKSVHFIKRKDTLTLSLKHFSSQQVLPVLLQTKFLENLLQNF